MGAGDFDWIAFGIGFATALLLVLFLRWRRARRGVEHLAKAPRATVAPTDLSPKLRSQILLLKAEGRSIEAIKMVRMSTGHDLKAAKEIVEGVR